MSKTTDFKHNVRQSMHFSECISFAMKPAISLVIRFNLLDLYRSCNGRLEGFCECASVCVELEASRIWLFLECTQCHRASAVNRIPPIWSDWPLTPTESLILFCIQSSVIYGNDSDILQPIK